MEPSQVFATGGASGLVGVLIYFIYKFLTTKHRVRSKCCGMELSVATEADTSPVPKIHTPPVVNADHTQSGLASGGVAVGERRAGSLGSTDAVGVPQDGYAKDEAKSECSPDLVAKSKDTQS